MSYFVTKYPHGTFSWADVMSQDMEKTKKFMQELLGWTSEDMPTEEGKPDYTMFYLDGKAVAGGAPAFDKNMPSHWNCYITVDDLDAAVKKVEKLGGTIAMPPMDVFGAGRMAAIQDPTGAHVLLWEAGDHIGAGVVNKAGAMGWNELYTKDVKKAQKFFGDLFGWTFEKDKSGYTTIKNNGRYNGGIVELTKEMGDMPPHWMVYFTVEDIKKSVKKVKKLGGKIEMGPQDMGDLTFAVVADPAQAHFIMIQMKGPGPEEWIE